MLYIHYTFPTSDGMREREWHVGEAPPNARLDDNDIVIHTVYADGHELEYIQQYFKNIPYKCASRSCTWRGELARFIFDNLCSLLPSSLQDKS